MRDDSITSCGSSQELLGDGARGEGPEVPPPPDATGLPSRPRRSRGELLKSAEVPEHQKQPYILCGYRQAPAGPCGLLATMFMLHNETVNMWTHLFGSLYAVGMGVHLVSTLDYDDHGAIEAEARWVLALVFTTAVCLLASFAYHLCNCTDQRVCQCMHKMDQTGIVCLIIMSYFSGISLFYRCFPRLRLFYLCFAGCVAAALATPFVFPSLVSHLPRHLIMCCAAGVVPAAHIMCIAPKHELMMALTYIIPMMACYGAGASIFIAQWPECWWPGRFDNHNPQSVPTARRAVNRHRSVLSPAMAEKRVDPEDGIAYTWDELSQFYKGKYKKKEVEAYWETCKPAMRAKKAKAKAEAEPKAKTKAKAKAKASAKEAEPKAKAKAKVKAKATAEPKYKVKAKPKESKPPASFKVCVCGGCGGIGQPLAMLMAMDRNVGELCIYDLNISPMPPAGVAQDLVHLERKCTVKGYIGEVGQPPVKFMEEALTGCNLVLIPAGLPRKPGQTRDDLFKVNADIAKGIVEACAKYCPEAVLAMIVNPVNSIVPAMAELYKKKGLDPMKIIGVTTLDVVRANKFVGEETGKNPNFISVPVIGGHAGTTILPLFSQDKAGKLLPAEKVPDMDKHVQDAGTDVVNAKNGKGSATLSMAYAGARFGSAILSGLSGRKRTECAYCASTVTDIPYFAQKVVLGPKGIEKVLPLGELNEHETKRLAEVKEQLKGEVETGLKYAEANSLE